MTRRQPSMRAVFIALVAYQILVNGPSLGLIAVFMTPLIRAFGWSHEQVSELAFSSTLMGGLVGFMVGWLLDRIGARWVMSIGLVLVAGSLWMASASHSLPVMVGVFAVYGMGFMLSGVLPVSVLVINWFGRRRGIAGGALWFALAVGMMSAPPLLTWLIAHYGWRAGFRWVSLPVIFVGLPISALVLRTRPPIEQARNTREEMESLPGLELGPALAAVGFWLIMLGDLLYSSSFGSVNVHSITYLIGLGYSPQHSAWVFSGQVCVSAFGSILFGAMADRIGARRALYRAMLIVPIGLIAFTVAGSTRLAPLAIALFILCWGLPAGCITPLLPLLLAETLGLRRLGTLSGIVRSGASIATAFGPLLAGWIFDVSGSYVPAFYLFAAAMVVAAGAIALVHPSKGHDVLPQPARAAVG